MCELSLSDYSDYFVNGKASRDEEQPSEWF